MSKLACAMAMLALLSHAALADYPTKPIRLIVPFPPGGTLDVLARGLSPGLSSELRQPIVVENRAGANGAIGYDFVAKAPADGYTLLVGGASGFVSHPNATLTPVAMLAGYSFVLVANPAFPPSSVRELVAAAKAAPGKITYGTPGLGNPNHLVAEWFQSIAGVKMEHAPYKGAALVVTDVIAGHIPIGFVILPGALPHLRTGKLKPLAVASAQRAPSIPDVPTMIEAGVPGLELSDWGGLLAPAGTSPDVVRTLAGAATKVASSPELRSRWIEQGLDPRTATPAELSAQVKSDIEKWNRIAREARIRID